MSGENYSQLISANGGAEPLIYSLASGTFPAGLVLNILTGELTGPINVDAEVKEYRVTIQARDNTGSTVTAAYTLTVTERAMTVVNKHVKVPVGSAPTNVDLSLTATDGPFVSADIVTVEMPRVGTVTIVSGEFARAGTAGSLGSYLKFVPNPVYFVKVSVNFRLTSALGVSNTGIVNIVSVMPLPELPPISTRWCMGLCEVARAYRGARPD